VATARVLVMVNLSDVIAPFGTLKNPVLFSSSSMSGAIMYFFHDLHGDLIAELAALFMLIMAVLIFLLGIGFYIYAFLRLPSSTQELIFLQEAKLALARHGQSGSKGPMPHDGPHDA
jgi:hypothetical protein